MIAITVHAIARLAVSLILMSGIEYVVHRWVMHRRFPGLDRWLPRVYRDHAVEHHGRGRNDLNIESPYWWLTLIVLSPLIAGLALVDPWLAVTFAAVVLAHNVVWSVVHREIHEPRYPWWSEFGLFIFWLDWHDDHHRQPNRNYAVLIPFWDLVLGTRYP